MSFIFVSHSQKDKLRPDGRLRSFAQFLTDAGAPLWIDKPEELGLTAVDGRALQQNGTWSTDIRDALNQCRAGLGIWSQHASARLSDDPAGVLFQELNNLGVSRRLFLINLDAASIGTIESKLGQLVANQQCVDLTVADHATFTLRVQTLCRSLSERLATLRIAPTPAAIEKLHHGFRHPDAGPIAPRLTPELLSCLNLQIDACRIRNLPVRMPHRLLAVLRVKTGFARTALNSGRDGFAQEFEQRLVDYVANQRDDVGFTDYDTSAGYLFEAAVSLAQAENAPVVDERIYLAALLADRDSSTIDALRNAVGLDGFEMIERFVAENKPTQRPRGRTDF